MYHWMKRVFTKFNHHRISSKKKRVNRKMLTISFENKHWVMRTTPLILDNYAIISMFAASTTYSKRICLSIKTNVCVLRWFFSFSDSIEWEEMSDKVSVTVSLAHTHLSSIALLFLFLRWTHSSDAINSKVRFLTFWHHFYLHSDFS